MDMIPYRLDQAEKRAEAADARMARIEDRLSEIQVSIEELKHSLTLSIAATKESVNQSTRNWGIGIMAIVIAAVLGIGELFIQASNNQLTAFEAGLSAVQTAAAVHSLPAAPAKP